MNIDMERLEKRLRAARGEIAADLVIAGGLVGNVYTGEWVRQDIALYDGIIVGLGDYRGPRVEVSGRYLVPGFIDGHVHLESSMLTPRELARALAPLGTTAIVTDPHEIANVWGTQGWIIFWGPARDCRWTFFSCCPLVSPPLPWEPQGPPWKQPIWRRTAVIPGSWDWRKS
jgi:adenine deaminase